MCLAKVYHSMESTSPVLEDVARMRSAPDGLELETLYGEKRVVSGAISEIDFVRSRVILVEAGSHAAVDAAG